MRNSWRGSEGRRGTPGSLLGKNGANETGRFDDMVDDEEGVGLVDGSTSMDDELKEDGMIVRRKSVFDDEDGNIKRVELRIGGMTVSLREACLQYAHRCPDLDSLVRGLRGIYRVTAQKSAGDRLCTGVLVSRTWDRTIRRESGGTSMDSGEDCGRDRGLWLRSAISREEFGRRRANERVWVSRLLIGSDTAQR